MTHWKLQGKYHLLKRTSGEVSIIIEYELIKNSSRINLWGITIYNKLPFGAHRKSFNIVTQAYFGLFQRRMMKLFAKIVNEFWPLTIFVKKLHHVCVWNSLMNVNLSCNYSQNILRIPLKLASYYKDIQVFSGLYSKVWDTDLATLCFISSFWRTWELERSQQKWRSKPFFYHS